MERDEMQKADSNRFNAEEHGRSTQTVPRSEIFGDFHGLGIEMSCTRLKATGGSGDTESNWLRICSCQIQFPQTEKHLDPIHDCRKATVPVSNQTGLLDNGFTGSLQAAFTAEHSKAIQKTQQEWERVRIFHQKNRGRSGWKAVDGMGHPLIDWQEKKEIL